MTRLAWALARLRVTLIVAGVRRRKVLPRTVHGRPEGILSAAAVSRGLSALEWSARAGARRLGDPDGRWQELANKTQILAYFRSAGDHAAPGGRRSSAPGAFADLWRREGRGYLWGREAASGGGVVADPGLPRRDLLPHHTGLGLGLASYHFEGIGRRPSASRIRRAVDRFLADGGRLSVPGFEGALVEALGLAIQFSHPRLVFRVDDELGSRSSLARSSFWHGVGRGLYFDRREMAPIAGERWRALERALDTPPGDDPRHNAVAGLAWATTLVNFREPRIIAARLRYARLAEAGDAAANGVASVALLWLDAVGDDPLLRALRGHRAGPDSGARELWQRQVAAPVEMAIARVYPLLVKRGRLEELFRYRPVVGWLESLGENGRRETRRTSEATAHG